MLPEQNLQAAVVAALGMMQAKAYAREIAALLKESQIRLAVSEALERLGPVPFELVTSFRDAYESTSDSFGRDEIRFLCHYLTGGETARSCIRLQLVQR
jgi:hypothetical protein